MSRRRLIGGVATVTLVIGVVLVIALATGVVSAVVTYGTSMLPRFHSGDLAVVLAAGSYHVGQIVAYYSPMLHTVVLHRIVAYHGGLFTFKGDNNSFLDPLKLPISDIKGVLVLHVPKAGTWLLWVKEPAHLAFVVACGALLLFGIGAPAVKRGARRRAEGGARPQRAPKEGAASQGSSVAVPLVLALAFAAIAGVGLSRPAVRASPEPVPYSQQVSFSYSASAAPSVVYPSGIVHTGQPVFLNLVSSIDVSTRFGFATKAAHTPLTGTMAETVTLVYGAGLSSVIEAPPPVALRSSAATVTTSVNLGHVAQMVAAADKATGVEESMPTIVVTATITSKGSVIGQPITTSFAPSLTFDWGSYELTLASQGGSGSLSSTDLQQSKSGDVYEQVPKAATVSFLGRSARVSTVRSLGEAGAAACVALALVMALWARRRGREDETVQIEARYGPQLIGVSTAPDDGQRSVVDVVEMAALVKVAETYGSVLLDHRQNGTHSYYTDGGTTIYRYQPASRSRGLGKRARPVLDLAEAQATCSSAAPDDPDQTAVEIGTLLGKVETWAASLLEEAAPQGDESRDDAELNATSLPVEPQAQAPLAEVDRAAEELEAALEARRSQAERELADSRETAEERLAAAREHAEQLRLEAERYRAEAKASSGKQLIEARRQAAEVLKEANEQAERIRAEAERELAAARERRENINAQLANVRHMLTVVEATTDGAVSVSEVLT